MGYRWMEEDTFTLVLSGARGVGGTRSICCATPAAYERYRAKRVYSIAKVCKMERLGVVRATENEDGSFTLHREDSHGPIIPEPEDLERSEASYRAAEERGDLPW